MGDDDLVTTTGEGNVDSVVGHIVKLGDIWEVVGNTDRDGKRSILFLFGFTDFLNEGEFVFLHTHEGIVVADHEVGVGLDTTDENAELTAVVVDDGTDLHDLFGHLISV